MDEPRLLGGRYELAEVLGYGGMAQVYRGLDRRLGRTVAVKTLRTDMVEAATFRGRFRREARAAAALDHPAIVRVYDTGEDTVEATTVPYIVMEYVEGHTLSEIVRIEEALTTDRALEVTGAVLAALRYSHESGIVHRDIKPGNVMVTESGDVKVMDFGIARVLDDGASTMTSSSMVIGTAHYLSPEQARGESADARSDLYSAGCMLYELLAGRPPFRGESAVSVAYQHVREEPSPPSAYEPDVPAGPEAVVMKALAKDPQQRYQSAGEMLADLHRARLGQPVSAPLIDRESTTDELEPVTEVTDPAAVGVPAGAALSAGDDGDDTTTGSQPTGGEGGRRRRVLLAALGLAIVAVVGVAAFTVPGWFGEQTGANPDGERDRGPAPVEETTQPGNEPAGTPTEGPAGRSTADSTSEPTQSGSGQRSTPTSEPTTTAPPTEDSEGTDEPTSDTPDPETETPDPEPEDEPTTTPPPETDEPTDPPEDEEPSQEPTDPPEDDDESTDPPPSPDGEE